MNVETRKNLIDVLDAASEICDFLRGMDFDAYRESAVTRRAVERNFEIIGEALNRINRADETTAERISECQRIISFRNILIHGYDIVDEAIVWQAAIRHLPILVKEIEEVLNA